MRKTARPVVWEGGDRKSTRLNSSHSLHAALPIKRDASTLSFSHAIGSSGLLKRLFQPPDAENGTSGGVGGWRSEEHTSELQSFPTRRSSDQTRRFDVIVFSCHRI